MPNRPRPRLIGKIVLVAITSTVILAVLARLAGMDDTFLSPAYVGIAAAVIAVLAAFRFGILKAEH